MSSFRFQNWEIWKCGAVLNRACVELAGQLEKRHWFPFAEQLRAAALCITTNIAEGSGSTSNAELSNFLNYSRRSDFETENMLLLPAVNGYLETPRTEPLLKELEEISRMISSFKRTLKP
ncbi:MAG: four helix bundle protein [Pirellulaceae bacterium]